jgi:hypothetical protein
MPKQLQFPVDTTSSFIVLLYFFMSSSHFFFHTGKTEFHYQGNEITDSISLVTVTHNHHCKTYPCKWSQREHKHGHKLPLLPVTRQQTISSKDTLRDKLGFQTREFHPQQHKSCDRYNSSLTSISDQLLFHLEYLTAYPACGRREPPSSLTPFTFNNRTDAQHWSQLGASIQQMAPVDAPPACASEGLACGSKEPST